MREALPERIDPHRRLRSAPEITGIYAIRRLERVASCVEGSDGNVTVTLRLDESREGLRMQGRLSGTLSLQCQRCLAAYDWCFDVPVNVRLLDFEPPASGEDEDDDSWVLVDGELMLRDFVEDEILLAMPQPPRHEGDDGCDRWVEQFKPEPEERRSNPFDVLRKLK